MAWTARRARRAGIRTMVGTPLRARGGSIGALIVYRSVLRPFEPTDLQLLQSFSDQAVIAIENARLLSDLRESLAQQSATADVLKVVSRSTFDLQTVLDTLVEFASRLCAAERGVILQRDGEVLLTLATFGFRRRPLDTPKSIRCREIAAAPRGARSRKAGPCKLRTYWPILNTAPPGTNRPPISELSLTCRCCATGRRSACSG